MYVVIIFCVLMRLKLFNLCHSEGVEVSVVEWRRNLATSSSDILLES